jgi:IS605 OrfB family transposase
LRKISKKERNFKRNTNHCISKKIVQTAIRHQKSIALEELKGFRKTVRKTQRDRFGKWAFGELRAFIEYKAQIAGIKFVKVDPRNTSRTCSRCGYCDKANRRGQEFECNNCYKMLNADLNAAINIAARAVVNQPIVSVSSVACRLCLIVIPDASQRLSVVGH